MFTLNFTSTVWRTTPYSFRCLLHLRNGVFIINKTSLCILCDYDLSTWHTVERFWFICIMFCEHAYCDMTLMCTCCDCLLLCLAHWPAAGNSVSRGGWSWHTPAVLRWDPALSTDVNWSKFCGNELFFYVRYSIHVNIALNGKETKDPSTPSATCVPVPTTAIYPHARLGATFSPCCDVMLQLLLGQKYGTVMIPNTIAEDEFYVLRKCMQGSERHFIDTWYVKDCNATPAVYVLQPRFVLFYNLQQYCAYIYSVYAICSYIFIFSYCFDRMTLRVQCIMCVCVIAHARYE